MIACRELAIPPHIDILYVEQEAEADSATPVEVVLRADTKRTELLKREQELRAILESESGEKHENQEAIMNEYNEVTTEMRIHGVHKAEPRARRILAGLGFTSEMQEQPTTSFSGGWRMRISLARALFMQPDLLLLDEPTNHLDLNAVIWLDNYLQNWKKTLLVVSHDQAFLSSVCQYIIHLDQKKLHYYKGDYDMFKKMQKQKQAELEKAYEKQQKEIRNLKISGKSRAAAEDLSRQKRLREAKKQGKKEEEEDSPQQLLERPREYLVKFTFPECPALSPPILSVEGVTFGYSPDHILLRDVDFGLHLSSRVSIVGPNGVGKSTLVKLIEGELTPLQGEVRRNPRLRIGKYAQHFVDKLPMDLSPVEYLQRQYPAVPVQELRNLLGRYGLEGHAHTIKNRFLSGGQKSRVTFAEISLSQPHMLILDEPTNHLDIESIDALGDAINEFQGGVLVVSHDARLLTMTNCEMWLMDNQTVKPIEGGYEAYRDSLLKEMEFSDDEDDDEPAKKDKEETPEQAKPVMNDEELAAAAFAAMTQKKEEKKKKHRHHKEGEEAGEKEEKE
ncbi:hypothetical protein WA588_005060, partial [Blastocystis sp. NMH]